LAGEAAGETRATASGSRAMSFVGGRYVVERLLGEGAMKRVYRAHDTRLDRDVAFAQLKADDLTAESRIRLRHEAQAMGRLGDHPNVVTIFDVGDEDRRPYLVSEYMAGGDVVALLSEADGNRLAIERAVSIAVDVCRALEHVHARGIIHRDLKPSNVWLAQDGTAKLGDFGLVLMHDRPRLSEAGLLYGTPGYMSPEQAMGTEPDARSDIYSLGAMLYELVTGRPPFPGDDPIAVITQHIEAVPVAPSWQRPELPTALESLILRLLSKVPRDRPASAAAVRETLEAISAAGRSTGPANADANPIGRLASRVWVGRDAEIVELRAALDDALSGHTRLVLLAGEPGIGKTRTVEEFGTYAQLRGADVLWGRCYEGDPTPPYWPWTQIMRAYSRDVEAAATEMEPWVADLAHIVPELRGRLDESAAADSEQARFRLFDSVSAFLRAASRRTPLVLVLDDLHAGDKASVFLLRFLARELRDARVLVLATYRDLDLARSHPLSETIGDLLAERCTSRVTLDGIGIDDVARFIELAAAIQPPPGLVATVYRETEGNPLFVNEVVRLLVAEGQLDRADDAASWSLTIPDGVREVIRRRLDRVSDACSRFLALAAVVGREFDLAVLERAGEESEDRRMDLLDEAIAARLVVEVADPPGCLRFSHVLIQEVLYGEIPGPRRARMHARIGRALEELHGSRTGTHLDELAYHFVAAAEYEKGVDYAARAGEQAAQRLAYEEAVSSYERALAALERLRAPDEVRGCELLLALGDAASHSGEPELAKDACARAARLARGLRDPERLARAALGYGGPSVTFGVVDAVLVDLLEEALAALPDGDGALRAMLLSRLAAELYFSAGLEERRVTLSREAVEMARRLELPAVLAYALNARHGALSGPENVEDRLAVATETVELAQRAGDRALEVQGRARRVVDLLELGDLVAANREIEAHASLADELRERSHQWYTLVWRSMRAHLDGKFDEAVRLAGEALALGRRLHESEAIQCYTVQMFFSRTAQGRTAELEELFEPWRELQTVPGWHAASAQLHSDAGRVEEARREFQPLAANGFADLPRDNTWLPAIACAAEACAFLQDASSAAVLYSLLRPYATRNVVAVDGWICLGAAARLLGLLGATMGDWERSGMHFEAALALNKQLGARPWLAGTQYQYAEMLLVRDGPADRVRAAELLGEAIETAERLGMTRLLERGAALRARIENVAHA
jgi:tetratricopeptide (TPR) repeat protein